MEQHFKEMSSPLMMGGDEDAASKGILGTCSTDDNQFFLLVLVVSIHISIKFLRLYYSSH